MVAGFGIATPADFAGPGVSALSGARRGTGGKKGIRRTSPGYGLFLILEMFLADRPSTRGATSKRRQAHGPRSHGFTVPRPQGATDCRLGYARTGNPASVPQALLP